MFGDGRDELLYQDAFDGSLINTASKILGTIFLKYLRASISYDRGVRVETYPFEYDAVREGIYNALIHNVYMMGIPIQIRIDDHTMEISNSCILPEDWTVDSLMETHKSAPYNPSIANVFYRMGYIENWGRGGEEIVGACDRLGAPRPEYKVVGYDITLYLHALESAVIRDRKGSGGGLEDVDDTLNACDVTLNDPDVTLNDPDVTLNGANVSLGESLSAADKSLDSQILQYLKAIPTATYQDLSTPSPSIKGGSGLLELGYRMKPGAKSPMTLDFGLNLWTGKRRGIGGALSANWKL
jgi:ATP-dependent DNA helicase RecG